MQQVSAAEWNRPQTPFAARTDLLPDTQYVVEGRGTFFTDEHGVVTRVEATYGGENGLNYDLHKPQPNVTYVVTPLVRDPVPGVDYSHTFVTDHLGRTVLAETDALSLGDATRSRSVQSRIGGLGGDGYDGGHLFGYQFGGGAESSNLVAMLRSVNQFGPGSFYELESRWARLLGETPPVDIRLIPIEGVAVVGSLRSRVVIWRCSW